MRKRFTETISKYKTKQKVGNKCSNIVLHKLCFESFFPNGKLFLLRKQIIVLFPINNTCETLKLLHYRSTIGCLMNFFVFILRTDLWSRRVNGDLENVQINPYKWKYTEKDIFLRASSMSFPFPFRKRPTRQRVMMRVGKVSLLLSSFSCPSTREEWWSKRMKGGPECVTSLTAGPSQSVQLFLRQWDLVEWGEVIITNCGILLTGWPPHVATRPFMSLDERMMGILWLLKLSKLSPSHTPYFSIVIFLVIHQVPSRANYIWSTTIQIRSV